MLSPDLLFLLPFTMGCALHDLKTGKIPNSFVLCGLLCGSATLLLSYAGTALSPFSRIHLPVFRLAQPDPASCILGLLLPYLLFGLPALLGMIGFYALFVLIRHRSGYQRFLFLRTYLCELVSVLHSPQSPPANSCAISQPGPCRSNVHLSGAAHASSAPSHPCLRRYRGTGTADAEFCFSVPIFLALLFLTLRAQFP